MSLSSTIYRKNTFTNTLLDFVLVLLIALIFVPQFKFLSAYNYLCLFVSVLWCVLAFSQNPRFFLGNSKYFFVSVLFFVLVIAFSFIVENKLLINRYSSFIMVPLFYWIYEYNAKYRGIKNSIKILFFSLIFILYTSVQTILKLMLNPYAARSIKTSTEGTEDLFLEGVSGYGLIYAVVILLIVLIPMILDWKKLGISFLGKIFILVLGLSFLYLIILSNYFTALIVTLMAILTIIVLYRNKKMLFILAPFTLLYIMFQKDINVRVLDTISSFVQTDGLTYRRIQEIKAELIFGSRTESVDSRSDVVNQSIDLLSEYPILGYATELGNNFDLNRVGQHSYIFDTYALFGLFLGTYSFWIMWLPFRYRITPKNGYKLRVFSWTVGFTFMILITMNNLTATMGFAAFFVFPTVFDYINKRVNG